jgi:hypothetical protein
MDEYVNNSVLVTGDAALDWATADGTKTAPPRTTVACSEAAVSQANLFEFFN